MIQSSVDLLATISSVAHFVSCCRMMLYRVRDYTTVIMLSVTSAVNLVGPWFCFSNWMDVNGYNSTYFINSAYLLQVIHTIPLTWGTSYHYSW